jgi:UDP-N-acetylglucosamine diphosphorylase / glucose-1-phosphate thymidylyltransferase / UDP-N-acetylgalactosamine diphosphorylase / glucosamine-1-phosphate N-acetyltransferase / galactosamine-1-phosphate N-acetyltransferase
MLLVVFDDKHHKSFYPIAQTRSVGDLRCGILKLRQRLEYIFADGDTGILIDDSLVDLYRDRHPDWIVNDLPAGEKLYLNSRLIISDEAVNAVKALGINQALINGEDIIALRSDKSLTWGFQLPVDIQQIHSALPLYAHIAQLIHDNGRLISWDFEHIFYDADNFFETEPGVSVLHPYNVWIAEGVELAPNVVLDASEGPIVIDEGARVMAGAVLCGPLYVGKKSLIKIAAKIYGGTSIGPVCKVGGEVEGSIFQAYSNKQHDGFLGHAYIGEWVNLGADTNNSDLKNTYKNVLYHNYLTKTKIDSGSQFMGSVIGDHSKTGINTSLNTGLVIGCACNIYGSGLFSAFVPDFSWGEAQALTEYRFSDFCDTAAIVKKRRNLELSDSERRLYQTISGD